MDYELLLDKSLQIGHDLLVNGAEISRVDDTLAHIYKAYGIKEINIFTITCSIVVTIKTPENKIYTQSIRVFKSTTNLDRVERLNALSRYICKNKPSLEYVSKQIDKIRKRPMYNDRIICLTYGMIAFTLAIYFSGTFADAIVAGLIGIVLKIALNFVSKIDNNAPVINVLVSFIAGILAVFAVKFNFGQNLDIIVISNIMLLIPGVALTNALRDMIKGDTMSGTNRLIETILIAAAVSFGFVMINMIIQVLAAGFASLGFAILYNVKGRKIWVSFFGGILTWGLYLILYKIFHQDVICYFLVTSFITFYVELAARIFKTPTTTFLVAAIIIIIPGGGLYRTIAALMEQRWQNFIDSGFNTLSIALAIAAGIMVVSSISSFFTTIINICKKNKSADI